MRPPLSGQSGGDNLLRGAAVGSPLQSGACPLPRGKEYEAGPAGVLPPDCDLDPPDGGFALAIRVAHLIREELERLELESSVKTSGADGIHVLVPIARRATYEQTYAFAERVARGLEEQHPGLVTTEWLKRKREGVLVDHRQNARGKTIASVYSARPKPGAPVSTPLRWDELTEDVTPRRFGMREALERVEQDGDLFEPVLAGGQALGRALKKLRLRRSGPGPSSYLMSRGTTNSV